MTVPANLNNRPETSLENDLNQASGSQQAEPEISSSDGKKSKQGSTEDDLEDPLDEVPDDLEMSLFDHLEELRQRIFYALIAVVISVVSCFLAVKPIVQLLEIPAQGVKFLQLSPGEYFFVSIKVAGYSGLLMASPFILYQNCQICLTWLNPSRTSVARPSGFWIQYIVLGGSRICLYVANSCCSQLLHCLRGRCGRAVVVDRSLL